MTQPLTESVSGHDGPTEREKPRVHLRITVNRRPFDEDTGVKEEMKGWEIAALVDVDRENAKVRHDNGADHGEPIGIDETVHVHPGDKFLVTRKTVEGGHA